MLTHQLLHRLLNFKFNPPPNPPLDLLMGVETYNIGVEGGRGNKIMPFMSHVQHEHSPHLQCITQQVLVSL